MRGARDQRGSKVLIVDDDPEMCALLKDTLQDEGYSVDAAGSGAEALEKAACGQFDLVITDVQMKGIKGVELTRRLLRSDPELPIIIITAFGSIESAVESMKLGAYHYLTKPFRMEEITALVEKALKEKLLRRDMERSLEESQASFGFGNLIGESRVMREFFSLMRKVADTPANILISGESGTGKELVARAIHFESGRGGRPFVPLNCAAIPEALLESELFGHVRGAFTGAHSDKKGLLETAHGGTIFLDEISEMPLVTQAKLLRVLQDGEVRPVGGTRTVRVDARVLSATNRNLEEEIKSGSFREDLFYRLNVIHLRLPPLRERAEDIPLLAGHFIRKCAGRTGKEVKGITEAALKLLLNYSWPGNVRELENVIERAMILGRGKEIRPVDLPDTIRGWEEVVVEEALQERSSLDELERDYILKVLEETGGNKQRAAQILGIDRKTLYRKLEQYER